MENTGFRAAIGKRPAVMVDTDDAPTYCRSRCSNGGCSRHISKAMNYTGFCHFALLKGTGECEGYIPGRVKRRDVAESGTKGEGRGGGI